MLLGKNHEAGSMKFDGNIAIFTFNGSGHNTFPTWKMNETAEIFEKLDISEIKAVVITAGDGRSFGVGGDFNEVSTFKGTDEIDLWIEACVRMYNGLLNIPVPVIAAIDGYTIGIALQLALCADYRVASRSADLRMPELKLGIACVLGACLLNERVSPHVSHRMIMTSSPWLAEKALEDGLIEEIAHEDQSTLNAAKNSARRFAEYQSVPFSTTKKFVNNSIIKNLEIAKNEAINAHRQGFSLSKEAQENMKNIIGKG
jgi:enoyl-CoA hydratase/carnithine racemase